MGMRSLGFPELIVILAVLTLAVIGLVSLLRRRPKRYCPKCGHGLDNWYVHCPFCGNELPGMNNQTPPPIGLCAPVPQAEDSPAPRQPPWFKDDSTSAPSRGRVFVIVAAMVGLFCLYMVGTGLPNRDTSYKPSTFETPVTQNILNSRIVIQPGQAVYYAIPIPPDARETHITGSFSVNGTFSNDIYAIITDYQNAQKWVNGVDAQVYWQSGPVASTSFDVKDLGPSATYYIAFSNRAAMLSQKTVFITVNLNYKR
jgi:hypothetical protein